VYNNAAWGAMPGSNGVVLTGLSMSFPANIDTFRPNVILPDFTDSLINCFTRKLKNTTTASGSGIASWSWNAGAAGTSAVQHPTFTFPGYGTYTVRLIAVDSNGCGDSITRTVTIPYIHFARAGNDTTTCTGVATMLHASGGIGYSWSPAATLGMPNAAVTTAMPSVNTTYIVTVTDTSGCLDQDTAAIKMVPGDQVIASPQDTLICAGKEVQLHAEGVVSYQWAPPADLSNAAIADPVASFKRTITYTVTGKDRKGCTSYDSISLRQRPAPDVDAYSFGDLTVSCFDHAVQLHASGAEQYTWQPGRYVNDSLIANPLASPPQTMLFTVTGVDEYGCSAQDTITVFSYKEAVVFVPDAFTPNGDGRNDAIRPLIYCDFNFERFEIYNRWGQKVFLSFRNDKGWDGNFNGEPAPLGVYMWYVKGHRDNGDAVMYHGDITLIR
jgi:gliding motility-associated-like protein